MAIKLADVLLYLGADDKGLDSDLAGAKGKTEGWASRLGGSVNTLLTGAVVGGAVAAAGAVVAIGTAAFDVSRETERAAANIAASLAIPREEAEKFADVARNVYGNNFTGSVEEAGAAVTEVTRLLKLGADDPSLQKMTEKALALKDSFGVEVNESISTVRTLMENFGLDADKAFDLVTAGFQRGLNRSDDFVDTINEYSVQFSNGGASAEEFFSIMESGLQGGMLGTDKAADAFKEFRVRILDGSKTTADALEQIGLSADDVTAQIDNGSMTIVDAWNLVVGKLKETEDQSILMQAGVGLIGTQFEDLGQDAILAMQITQDAFANAAGATDALNAKYENFGDATTAIWRRLIVSVSPLTDKLLDMANAAIPYLMAAFDRFDQQVLPALIEFGGVVQTVVGAVVGFFQGLGSTVDSAGTGRFVYFKEWIDSNLPLVRNLVETILGAIQRFWEENGQAIMNIVQTSLSTIMTIFDTVLKTILDLVTVTLQLLNGDFEGAAETMIGIVRRLWETVKEIFGAMLANLRELVLGIDWAGLGWSIVQGIGTGIKNGAGFLYEVLKQGIQSALAGVASFFGIGGSGGSRSITGADSGRSLPGGRSLLDAVSRLGEPAVGALAASTGSAAGGTFQITVNNTFNGPADEMAVKRGVDSGIVSSMRSLGLR
ncbi:MAG TPA: phage tail tape measure protein [Candidatus Competibacter phosphatis]|nr:phage tail tape measure protein [Candidatus Competibacter phosphatis]